MPAPSRNRPGSNPSPVAARAPRCARRSSRARSFLGLLGEELADRLPHVVLRGEVARADGESRGLQFTEDLRELRVARPESGDAAGFAVAAVVHLLGDLGERAARLI